MPKYGFSGNIMIRCTAAQTFTLRKMLERQRVQPTELTRQLIAAACAFLDAGGRLEFPLRIVSAEYEEREGVIAMVAEAPGQKGSSVRDVIEAAEAALRNPAPPSGPQGLPKSPLSAGGKRGKKPRRKRDAG